MKTILLLSTLAVGLFVATQSFAQATNYGPTYPYPTGYQDYRTQGSNGTGWSDHQDRAERR
jgi:hypothetical protein